MYIEFGSKGRFGQFGSEAEDYFVEDMSGRTGLAQAKLPAEESCVIAVTTVKLFWDIVKNLVKTMRYIYICIQLALLSAMGAA